jgi:hypothetical protein
LWGWLILSRSPVGKLVISRSCRSVAKSPSWLACQQPPLPLAGARASLYRTYPVLAFLHGGGDGAPAESSPSLAGGMASRAAALREGGLSDFLWTRVPERRKALLPDICMSG